MLRLLLFFALLTFSNADYQPDLSDYSCDGVWDLENYYSSTENISRSEDSCVDIYSNNYDPSHSVLSRNFVIDVGTATYQGSNHCNIHWESFNFHCVSQCPESRPYFDENHNYCTDVQPPSSCDPATEVQLNGQCQKCPAGTHPSSDGTYCPCDDGLYPNDYTNPPSCTKCIPPQALNPSTGLCDDTDCSLPKIPTPDWYETAHCYDPNDPNDPNYPPDSNSTSPDSNSTPPTRDPNAPGDGGGGDSDDACPHPDSMFGQPFQGIMDFSTCIFTPNAWTYNCSGSDKVACYYSDSNSTSPDDNTPPSDSDTDSNSTAGGDTNTTGGDIDGVNGRLDTIIDELSSDGQINKSLGDLGTTINNAANGLGDKLDAVKTRINGMNQNLGDKLDAIKNAINNKPTGGTDMTNTNDLLREISDKLSPDTTDREADFSQKMEQGKTALNDALSSFETSKNDLIALANGMVAPTFAYSGQCAISTPLFNGIYKIDLSDIGLLRPYVQFILNLILLYLSLRFYVLIARDIVSYIF